MVAVSNTSGSTGAINQVSLNEPLSQVEASQTLPNGKIGHQSSSESDGDDAAETSYDMEFDPTHCLFCVETYESIDTNLEHMARSHGMIIPSPHQLTVDSTTLLTYLNLIISVYHECLTCGTQRRNAQAIKQHMLGKKHCAFDISDVASEYREFWDLEGEGSGVEMDGDNITLPSGKVVLSRSVRTVQQQHQRSSGSSLTSLSLSNSSPVQASDLHAPLLSDQASHKQALTRQDVRALRVDKQLTPPDRKSRTTTTASVKRRKVDSSPPSSPPDAALDEFIRTPKHNVSRTAKSLRSPSTSPPPAPPKQEFMRPGWDADDGWRMVTDEFMATAQLFTTHLAHAEYRRQKELAKKRERALGGADAIARPVVGQLSKDGQRKKMGELQRAGVKAVLKADEEEEDDPWVGTQLAGLMASPRKRERLQPVKVVGRSSTRAAAGFDRARPLDLRGRPLERQKSPDVKESQIEEDTTDDDLDAAKPSRSLSRPPHAQPTTPTRSRSNNVFKQFANPRIANTSIAQKPSHHPSSSTTYSSDLSDRSSHKKCKSIDREISRPPNRAIKAEPSQPAAVKAEPDFGFPPIPQPSQSATSAVARRREARLKREREERKIKTENQEEHELPTFLF
ncbi:hypothetical protein E4T48_05347 [Aureobasidium sp. EXF-10727]|nr:hypothetical protein E4T48_05347 [Aureobasidium sp. EXF-10727]